MGMVLISICKVWILWDLVLRMWCQVQE